MKPDRIIYLLFGTILSCVAMNAHGATNRMGLPRQTQQAPVHLRDNPFPVTGSPRVLVILAEFQDTKFGTEDPAGYYESMLNGMTYSEERPWGSAQRWFSDNSDGRFIPHFDIVGPVTLPHASGYYGDNNAFGTDRRPLELITDACAEADALIDFSGYDSDGDKTADYVHIYYAGQGESTYGQPSTVWPHGGSLLDSGIEIRPDGIRIDRYSCTNEWMADGPDGFGPFLHQFLTFLGVPPLGDGMDDGPTATPGRWSVMDTGCYNNNSQTPPFLSAFERMTLGWLDPEIVTEPGLHSLRPLHESGDAVRIPCGEDGTEYFLIEYRMQEEWDSYLPNHGLLVWHIDLSPESMSSGLVNKVTDHHRVRLLKPNCKETADRTASTYDSVLRGWCLPGTTGLTGIDDFTEPSMRPWSGERLYFPLSGITENANHTVSFALGDSGLIHSPEIREPDPDETGPDFFTIRWSPVEGAERYLISVYPERESKTGEVRCDFGNSVVAILPLGWEASGTTSFTSPGYYGKGRPSLRFKEEGAYLVSEWTSEPITSLSFWLLGVNHGASTVALTAIDSRNNLHMIGEIELPYEGERFDLEKEDIPEDTHQLQWRFHRMEGSAAIDDIVIGTGETILPLEGFDRLDAGEETFMLIEGLPADRNVFRVAVRAVIGDRESPESEFVKIRLERSSKGLLNDVPEVRIDTMTVNADGTVTVRTIDGRTVGSGTEVSLPGRGVYIISGENGYLKIVV